MAYLDDGFSTIVTFAGASTIKLKEVSVKPPGVDGGGGKDTSTMRNTAIKTMAPGKLKKITDGSMKAAYDPAVFQTILSRVNVNDQITITWPDASTLVFWGWIDSFEPTELVENGRPVADVKFVASNVNSSGVETAPVQAP